MKRIVLCRVFTGVSLGIGSSLLSGFFGLAAQADPIGAPEMVVDWENVILGGNGCLVSEGAALTKGGHNEFLLSIPNFTLELNASQPERVGRVVCQFGASVRAPQGYRVSKISTQGKFLMGKSARSTVGFGVKVGLASDGHPGTLYSYEQGTSFAPAEYLFQDENILENDGEQCGLAQILKGSFVASALRSDAHDWAQFQLPQNTTLPIVVELEPCR